MFEDREAAGQKLAAELERYRGADAVVVALPRGGVAVGFEVARALGLSLDVVVTRKVGHPQDPEYAIGAVDASGTELWNEAERGAANEDYLAAEVARQQREAARREAAYRGDRRPLAVKGRTVLLVDDGIATGLTIRLAVAALRRRAPRRLVVAVPVAPSDIVDELAALVDEVVVLEPPESFRGAVGAHYENFTQVTDHEVVELLDPHR
jgi:predicted phosphoribosyltransferase